MSRNLLVKDETEAAAILQNINYYRLSAYFPPFQTEKDVFDKGTTIESILSRYEFDRELQNLILDILANIEISVRTQLIWLMRMVHLGISIHRNSILTSTTMIGFERSGRTSIDLTKCS